MHIILTHEQADFDALASLLGATLLHDEAIPVMPRRMNQNARAFIQLYGVDLPFIETRDLPGGNIGTITLVDTQSMVTLKGFTSKTQVLVIDHHQIRSDLPAGWQVTTEKLGATTTLLVEGLQETGRALNCVQATLLLLGIYEDTGSLIYPSTTPRDILAAAYLLGQGANLRAAARFLNPALTKEQRTVYERLLNSIEWRHIGGQNIAIACAEANELEQEVSSVAHKIRDLLDPDGLILLVTTPEGIRLVARSTTNRVDVARIASYFGGGGHERAAAALIHVQNTPGSSPVSQLQAIREELIRILPENIQPSLTIGQIMSSRPRTLSPQTSAQEASRMMQRYGYEGYPVVDHGRVIGLLNRRTVDRALSHKLNLTAENLMEAGEHTVTPDQTIEHLQHVMITSNWGQIPVVDPQTHAVIGIVTRTDLLKSLGGEIDLASHENLTRQLEAALPPTRFALLKIISQTATEEHVPVYIVGGFVRDLLMDRPCLDFDIVVEGDAIALARQLSQKFGGRITTHSRFGTAKWDISEIKGTLLDSVPNAEPLNPDDLPQSLDLITARTEFYDKPTALPTVERSSIKLDLHRRDFTINTLAIRLDGKYLGELHDYWGGLSDIQQGMVRVMHSLSFIDDPTRLLRAVRFEQRFQFTIEYRTNQLMEQARELLDQVSGDRLRHELNFILEEEHAEKMLTRLEDLHLLQAIHPNLPSRIPGHWITPNLADYDIPEKIGGQSVSLLLTYTLWFAGLTTEQAVGIAKRLKLSRLQVDLVLSAIQLAEEIPALTSLPASEVTFRLDNLPLLSVYAIYQLVEDRILKGILQTYITRWRKMSPFTTGDSLREMGYPPGPGYRKVLINLRKAWLDGMIQTKEQEDIYLATLLRQTFSESMEESHGNQNV